MLYIDKKTQQNTGKREKSAEIGRKETWGRKRDSGVVRGDTRKGQRMGMS